MERPVTCYHSPASRNTGGGSNLLLSPRFLHKQDPEDRYSKGIRSLSYTPVTRPQAGYARSTQRQPRPAYPGRPTSPGTPTAHTIFADMLRKPSCIYHCHLICVCLYRRKEILTRQGPDAETAHAAHLFFAARFQTHQKLSAC